jgi:hypothetical protein
MENSVFWDIKQCSPWKANTMFRRRISPPSSGLKIIQARNRDEADGKQNSLRNVDLLLTE